jgi:hypothetical protein
MDISIAYVCALIELLHNHYHSDDKYRCDVIICAANEARRSGCYFSTVLSALSASVGVFIGEGMGPPKHVRLGSG